MEKKADWQWEISAHRPWFHLNLRELFQYKDLFFRFVRRDIIASYQQTILGPIWVFLQPLFTTFVYFIIFSRVAKISTDGIPPFLFYLPGTIIWSYYADCVKCDHEYVSNTMHTFLTKCISRESSFPSAAFLFHSFRISIQLLLFLVVCYCICFKRQSGSFQLAGFIGSVNDLSYGLFCIGLRTDHQCSYSKISGP